MLRRWRHMFYKNPYRSMKNGMHILPFKKLNSISLDYNLSFREACPYYMSGHPFVHGNNPFDYGKAIWACIQLAQHQHWCCLWELTKDVNTL